MPHEKDEGLYKAYFLLSDEAKEEERRYKNDVLISDAERMCIKIALKS